MGRGRRLAGLLAVGAPLVPHRMTVWLGAANQYWIVTSLLDGPPLAIDEDRFVAGWVDLLMRVLIPAPHPKGQK